MKRKLIFAGSGGQGVLMMANLISNAAIDNGLNAVMSQTYGIEQRGGDCTAYVVLSDQPIGSPIVENDADICVIMSGSMLEAHIDAIQPRGTMVLNSSLIRNIPDRKNIRYITVPATDLANKVGDIRYANMVAIGAMIADTQLIEPKLVLEALDKFMEGKKKTLHEANQKAFEQGIQWIRRNK